jgi:polar amino acid transport system substrate-binding protein
MNKKSSFITLILLCLVGTVLIFFHIMWQREKLQNNALLVGTNTEFPPFCFMQDGMIAGFDIDLIHKVSDQLQMELIVKDMSFDALLPELQLGHIQLIAAGLTPTAERAQRVLFTKPHLEDELVILVKTESSVQNLSDLFSATVAVNEGYSAERYLKQFSQIRVESLQSASITEGLLALNSGRAAAFIVAKKTLAPFLTAKVSSKYRVVEIPNSKETYAFAVSKKYPALRDRIDQVLDGFRQDGTLSALATKWGL